MKMLLSALVVAVLLAGCAQGGFLPSDNSDDVRIKHRIPSK